MTAARVATVTNTVQRPGTASPVKGLSVTIRLNVLGFIDGGSTEKVNTRFVETDDDGVWSCELEANADIDPAGTYYTVKEGKIATWSIVVPPAGSPVNLRDILVEDPANPLPMVAGVPLPGSGVPAGDVWITDGLGGGDYAPPAGGGGAVDSVFGRDGDVTAEVGDYATFYDALGAAESARVAAIAAADTYTDGQVGSEATARLNADNANALAIANEATRAQGVEAVKADLVAGKVPTSQLPALAINEVFPVASQAAMLALTAQRGDIARRTDFTPNHLFLLTTDSPATLGDWLLIVSDPGAGVDTVNGQSGTVVLGAADVGADTAAARDTAIANQHTTDVSLFQPADPDLTAIAGLDATTAGALVTDGTGWIRKTYAQLKTALGLVKGDVGLGNVDNTSDVNKPVSTAQAAADATVLSNAQTYADGKVLDSIADADTSHAPSRNAVFDALALKAPLASPTFTGTVTVPTPVNPTDASTKQYVDTAVTGLLDFRGSYDASVNTFPASGGSGTAGAVVKGDVWVTSVGGTLGGVAVTSSDLIVALADAPGQTAGNWDLVPHDGAYVTLTGNQTVAGTKTFSTSPVVPTPAAADNSTKAASTAYVDTASGLLVPKSLFTTKGDLLVATASGVVTRRGVGSDGQVLTADSAQADGVKWAAAASSLTKQAKTANYTAVLGDMVLCDTTGGTFTVTLPAASGGKGTVVVKWTAGTVAPIIAVTGSDHIDTATGSTGGSFTLLNQAARYESDGTALWIIGANNFALSTLDTRYPELLSGVANSSYGLALPLYPYSAVSSGFVPATGTVYVYEFVVDHSCHVTGWEIFCSAAGTAGAKVYAAIYGVASDGSPGPLVSALGTGIAMDAGGGVKTSTGLSVALTPGKYYVAFCGNPVNALTCGFVSAANRASITTGANAGTASGAGSLSATIAAAMTGTAWNSTLGTITTITGSAQTPAFRLDLAA